MDGDSSLNQYHTKPIQAGGLNPCNVTETQLKVESGINILAFKTERGDASKANGISRLESPGRMGDNK